MSGIKAAEHHPHGNGESRPRPQVERTRQEKNAHSTQIPEQKHVGAEGDLGSAPEGSYEYGQRRSGAEFGLGIIGTSRAGPEVPPEDVSGASVIGHQREGGCKESFRVP